MTELLRNRIRTPSPAAAAVAATLALLLCLLWQNAMDGVAAFGLSAFAFFERLTTFDRRVLTILLLSIAGALWLWSLRGTAPPETGGATPIRPGPGFDRLRRRALALGIGLVFLTAVVAPVLFGEGGGYLGLIRYGAQPRTGHTLNALGTLLWAVGTLLYLWSVMDWGGARARLARYVGGEAPSLRVTSTVLALLGILLAAAWLRFFDLDTLPFEMTSDHTEKLLDVARVVAGNRPVFLPLNGGREPMQFYWTALLVLAGLPLSFLTLKIGMAVVSVLTVPPQFALGRSIGGRQLGLLSALVLALAPWHLQITRIALRAGFSALFSAVVLWLLLRALETGRRNDFVLLAVAGAAGLYGYSGYRPMPILVVLVIAAKLAWDAWARRRAEDEAGPLPAPIAGHLAAAFGAAVLVATPMLRFALDRPDDFWGRTLSRVSGAEVALAQPPLQQLLSNYQTALLMFNVTSDAAWFHSPAGRPALETVGGALLVLGALTALARLLRGDWKSGVLLVAVPVMLLSSAMALAFPVEVPHLTRASGALPAVAVLVALPLPHIGRRWAETLGRVGTLVYLALLAILFLSMARNTDVRVFQEYRTGYDNASHPTREGAEVARAFLTLGGDLEHVYLVSWPHGWDYRALALMLGDADWRNVLEGTRPDMSDAVEGAGLHVEDPSAKLYFVGGPNADANIQHLRRIHPDAVVTMHPSRMPGKDFWSVYVPPADG